MRVAQAVGESLAELGVDHFFGLLGSGNLAVTNALAEAGATFIASRHEGSAITMADAYARVSGRIGVCTVHQGPGLTNTITGLTEAVKSRTPLVLLAADTASSALLSNFRINQDLLVASVGAASERLHGPETAVTDAARAFTRARLERRPVVLMMPLDVQAAEFPDTAPALARPGADLQAARPSAGAVRSVVERLRTARRPLVIAGRGAVLAEARAPLEKIGDLCGALLATSAVGNGLFAGSPWSLGISGGFASPLAAELIAQADLVVAFGASLNMWTTRHGQLLAPDAFVVQVDHDPDAIGAHHRVDLGVLGDVRETAWALVEELELGGDSVPAWRTPSLGEQIARRRWRDEPYVDESTPERIDPRTLSLLLDAILPAERTIAIDSGHFMGYPAMYLAVPGPDAFVFTQAFQSIGLGLAGSIGASIARPDRLAVAALGDGGALMALPEFETAGRLGLNIMILVYNDAAYGAEVHHFEPMGQSVDLVRFPETDFAALGRAVGMAGVTVRRPEDLEAIRTWVTAGARGGLVVDAKIVPSVVAGWLEEAFRGH